jgi:hypothetical protein
MLLPDTHPNESFMPGPGTLELPVEWTAQIIKSYISFLHKSFGQNPQHEKSVHIPCKLNRLAPDLFISGHRQFILFIPKMRSDYSRSFYHFDIRISKGPNLMQYHKYPFVVLRAASSCDDICNMLDQIDYNTLIMAHDQGYFHKVRRYNAALIDGELL